MSRPATCPHCGAALKLTPAQRVERAKVAAAARWGKPDVAPELGVDPETAPCTECASPPCEPEVCLHACHRRAS